MTLPPSEETVISGFEIVSITIVLAHVDVVTSGNLAKFCNNFSSRPNNIIGQEQHN